MSRKAVSGEKDCVSQPMLKWREKHVIKIITGVRRCGKSTLMMQFQQQLREEKVSKKQIISVNLEDLAFENLRDYRELYRYITTRMVSGKMNYII